MTEPEESRLRWLTRSWVRGQMTDRQADARYRAYQRHLVSIVESGRGGVRELAAQQDVRLDLKDARVDYLDASLVPGALTLSVVQGNLQTSYGQLTLRFGGASLVQPSLGELRDLIRRPRTEVRVVELERVSDLAFELRLLLHPSGELDIRFEDFEWEWIPRADREDPPLRKQVLGADHEPPSGL